MPTTSSMSLSFRHLLNADQLQAQDLQLIFTLADLFRSANFPDKDAVCRGKLIATLFFEASTRTRFSFEAAILRLGGQLVTLEQGKSSSINKGESLSDMARIMSNYVDLVVIRHPQSGSIHEFADGSLIPVINAGDGENQHPTQSLIDIYTIKTEKKRIDNLNIGIVGDLLYSRSVHSLVRILAKYPNNKFYFIANPAIGLDQDTRQYLVANGAHYVEGQDLANYLPNLDVMYVSRIQQERFASRADYLALRDDYIVTPQLLVGAREDLIIMHALPRVNEIDTSVDSMPYAKYFDQAAYGLYVRKSLLSIMLGYQPSVA